ncbi:MAG: HAMP domain-containing histidine kinase [Bacteroidales bacterium]|nr:HAMP domain-containing histidine kinase [Bacteroidales bacterium]
MLWSTHDEIDKESQKIILESITQGAKETFNLLDNLLKWASSNSGSMLYKPKQIKLNDIVNENINIYKTTADSKKISFNNLLEENLMVYVDFEMINTVIRNLISNAVKYTKENGNIDIISTKDSDNMVTVGVSDSGIGIKKGLLAKLFDIDSVHSSLGTNKEKGSGLGLKLCKEFVEKNNGVIWVESKETQGTTFYILLPSTSAG